MYKLMSHWHSAQRYYRPWRERKRYEVTYYRYKDYTMIPLSNYVNTLRLAKNVTSVDGCVVQCGVWKGGMAAGLVSVLGTQRDYFLYDSFEGLPKAKAIDGKAALDWQSNARAAEYYDNCSASPEFAERAMMLSGAVRYHLIKGWFSHTLSQEKPRMPIAFLHLDADWYESISECLKQLFDSVAMGGLIVVDDYFLWDGTSRALHDFLSNRSAVERIRHLEDICFVQKASPTPSPELIEAGSIALS
jgi:O-methyltransferase